MYKYIDQNIFTARNIDLPRKVKYKPRRVSFTPTATIRAVRIGRPYIDFTRKLQDAPDTQVVEMDTVEGQKGGKVLLTLLFRSCTFMLAILLEDKTELCKN